MNANEFQKNLLKIMGLPEKAKRHKSAKSAPRIVSETGKVVFEHDVIAHEQTFNEMETREIPLPEFPNLCRLFSDPDLTQCVCVHLGLESMGEQHRYRPASYEWRTEYTEEYHKWRRSWESLPPEEKKETDAFGKEYELTFDAVYDRYKKQIIRHYGYWKHQFVYEETIQTLIEPEYIPECINLVLNRYKMHAENSADPRINKAFQQRLDYYRGTRMHLYDEVGNIVEFLYLKTRPIVTVSYRGRISEINVNTWQILLAGS